MERLVYLDDPQPYREYGRPEIRETERADAYWNAAPFEAVAITYAALETLCVCLRFERAAWVNLFPRRDWDIS